MSAFQMNPIAYVIPALMLGAVVVYYLYGAVDHVGLDVRSADAVVIEKQHSAGSTTYTTNVVGGRTSTQSHENPDMFAISLQIGEEQTVGLVSEEMFEALGAGDQVRVKVRRTRIGGQLEVVEVSR